MNGRTAGLTLERTYGFGGLAREQMDELDGGRCGLMSRRSFR